LKHIFDPLRNQQQQQQPPITSTDKKLSKPTMPKLFETSQPSSSSSSSSSLLQFSVMEIDGRLYYLSSLHADECILTYSHTMSVSLLDTFVKYATGLSNEKMTTIVFKNAYESSPPSPPSPSNSQEKKVVGFWHPQLSKFVLDA
jgi:hypothetical protein